MAKYGQCGGIGYTGATDCCTPTTCQSSSDYYSQCLDGTTKASATTTQTPVSKYIYTTYSIKEI